MARYSLPCSWSLIPKSIADLQKLKDDARSAPESRRLHHLVSCLLRLPVPTSAEQPGRTSTNPVPVTIGDIFGDDDEEAEIEEMDKNEAAAEGEIYEMMREIYEDNLAEHGPLAELHDVLEVLDADPDAELMLVSDDAQDWNELDYDRVEMEALAAAAAPGEIVVGAAEAEAALEEAPVVPEEIVGGESDDWNESDLERLGI